MQDKWRRFYWMDVWGVNKEHHQIILCGVWVYANLNIICRFYGDILSKNITIFFLGKIYFLLNIKWTIYIVVSSKFHDKYDKGGAGLGAGRCTQAGCCSRQQRAPPASSRTKWRCGVNTLEVCCRTACSSLWCLLSLLGPTKSTADHARTFFFDCFRSDCDFCVTWSDWQLQQKIQGGTEACPAAAPAVLITKQRPHMTPPPTRSIDAHGHLGINNGCFVILNW